MTDISADQFKEAAKKAYAAGDVKTARSLIARAKTATPAEPTADMSLMGRLKDNFIGVDDGQYSVGERAADLLNAGGEGLTLGAVGDEAAAAADAAVGLGSYDERLGKRRAQEAHAREQMPVATIAAEVAPAFIPGLGLAAAGRSANLAARSLKAAGAGAAGAGAYGFAEGEGGADERLDDGLGAAAAGAVLGGMAPAAGRALSRVGRGAGKAQREFIENQPTIETLKTRADELYDLGRQKGRSLRPGEVVALNKSVVRGASKAGLIRPDGTRSFGDMTSLKKAVDDLEAFDGMEMTPEHMLQIRSSLQGAAESMNRRESRLGTQLLKKFDSVAERAVPEFKEARAVYRRFAKAQDVAKLEELIDLRSSQYANGGLDNAARTEARQLVRGMIRNKERGWSADERKILERVAKGSRADDALRDLARLRTSFTLQGMVNTGGAFAAGSMIAGPVGGAVAAGATGAAGHLANRSVTRAQAGRMELLNALARSADGQMPALPQPRNALAIEGALQGAIATQTGGG